MFGKGINASGHVVGEYDLGPGTTSRAFRHDGTTLVDIGTLGGTYARAAEINAAGVIVGSSTLAGDLDQRAFLYSAGTMTALGTLGGSYSIGTAINDSGQVTGYSERPDKVRHAFLYSGGTMTDLGSLGGRKHRLGRQPRPGRWWGGITPREARGTRSFTTA